MTAVSFLGDEIVIDPQGQGFVITLGDHVAQRFIQRVRPGLSLHEAKNALYTAKPICFRQRKREPDVWYLLYRVPYTPAYAIVARQEFKQDRKRPGAVLPRWKAITCLYGHDHR